MKSVGQKGGNERKRRKKRKKIYKEVASPFIKTSKNHFNNLSPSLTLQPKISSFPISSLQQIIKPSLSILMSKHQLSYHK